MTHQSDEYYQDRISELECMVEELTDDLATAKAELASAVREVNNASAENEWLRAQVVQLRGALQEEAK
jgi:regulator of replication initiation timing